MATNGPKIREHAGRRQYTITVSPELGRYLEERAMEAGTNKSAVVGQALEADRERRKRLLMREGYEEMAGQNLELEREFEQAGVDDEWPEY